MADDFEQYKRDDFEQYARPEDFEQYARSQDKPIPPANADKTFSIGRKIGAVGQGVMDAVVPIVGAVDDYLTPKLTGMPNKVPAAVRAEQGLNDINASIKPTIDERAIRRSSKLATDYGMVGLGGKVLAPAAEAFGLTKTGQVLGNMGEGMLPQAVASGVAGQTVEELGGGKTGQAIAELGGGNYRVVKELGGKMLDNLFGVSNRQLAKQVDKKVVQDAISNDRKIEGMAQKYNDPNAVSLPKDRTVPLPTTMDDLLYGGKAKTAFEKAKKTPAAGYKPKPDLIAKPYFDKAKALDDEWKVLDKEYKTAVGPRKTEVRQLKDELAIKKQTALNEANDVLKAAKDKYEKIRLEGGSLKDMGMSALKGGALPAAVEFLTHASVGLPTAVLAGANVIRKPIQAITKATRLNAIDNPERVSQIINRAKGGPKEAFMKNQINIPGTAAAANTYFGPETAGIPYAPEDRPHTTYDPNDYIFDYVGWPQTKAEGGLIENDYTMPANYARYAEGGQIDENGYQLNQIDENGYQEDQELMQSPTYQKLKQKGAPKSTLDFLKQQLSASAREKIR